MSARLAHSVLLVIALAACFRSGFDGTGAGDHDGVAYRLGLGLSSSCWLHSSILECWGNNDTGQLGGGPPTSHQRHSSNGFDAPVQVATGEHFACVLVGDGTVQCWGANDAGQLGDGTTTARATAAPVLGVLGLQRTWPGRARGHAHRGDRAGLDRHSLRPVA